MNTMIVTDVEGGATIEGGVANLKNRGLWYLAAVSV